MWLYGKEKLLGVIMSYKENLRNFLVHPPLLNSRSALKSDQAAQCFLFSWIVKTSKDEGWLPTKVVRLWCLTVLVRKKFLFTLSLNLLFQFMSVVCRPPTTHHCEEPVSAFPVTPHRLWQAAVRFSWSLPLPKPDRPHSLSLSSQGKCSNNRPFLRLFAEFAPADQHPFCTGGPKTGHNIPVTVQEVLSRGHNHCHNLLTPVNAAQNIAGVLCCQGPWPAHVHLSVHQDACPTELLSSQPVIPQLGVPPSQVQHFTFVLQLPRVSVGPLLQSV